MNLIYRLQAGVLPLVLVVCLIFTFFTSALILLSYTQRSIIVTQNIKSELHRNALSGLNICFADLGFDYDVEYGFDLYEKGEDSVNVIKKRWGLMDLAISTAKRGDKVERIGALIGTRMDTLSSVALYLVDTKKNISLAGKTKIQGKTYLDKSKLRTAIINGVNYQNNKLIYGEINNSSDRFPKLQDNLYERIKYYKDRLFMEEYVKYISLNDSPDLLFQSFDSSTIVIEIDKGRILSNKSLKGNIIIYSEAPVIVKSNNEIKSVVIIAPKVTIESNFTGQLQIFATDTVEIGEQCTLYYPSVICLSSKQNGFLNIGKNSKINGIVLLVQDDVTEDFGFLNRRKLIIEEEAEIMGEVYADAQINLRGSVWGTIVGREFFLSLNNVLFENHLFNARIEVNKRHKHYITSQLLSSSKDIKVVEWVY